MKTTKRSWIIRIAFVLVLVLVAVLMLRIGLKINIEQALLPSELVASRGKKFRIIFHRPISRAELERMKADGLSLGQIADRVRQFVYSPNSH